MSVRLSRTEGEVVLTGWSGEDTPRKCKAVAGHRFNPHKKRWSFPLSMDTCRDLRAQFGEDLSISPGLNAWAREALSREKFAEQAKDTGYADLPALETQFPALAKATAERPYQRVAARWGSEKGNFLLADQQGLGKTLETLATVVEHDPEPESTRYHLIVAPKVAVSAVWEAEISRWLGRGSVQVLALTGSLQARQIALCDLLGRSLDVSHVFVLANIESARIKPEYHDESDPMHKDPKWHARNAVLPAIHSIHWGTIVVDECQRALIRVTGKYTQARAGFHLLSENSNRRIALSGTPMRGKPEQLWGTLHWLQPRQYPSYWRWVGKYWEFKSNGFSKWNLNGHQPNGQVRLAADMQSIMLRRTKEEVLPDLPPKTYAGWSLDPDRPDSPFGVWIAPTKGQLAQLDQLDRNAGISGEHGEVVVSGALADYTRRKQIADSTVQVLPGAVEPTLDSGKYEWLLDWLAGSDGAKVVVASQFTNFVQTIRDGIEDAGYTTAEITGDTPDGVRTKNIERFQTTDEIQVFLLNTKAGGVAVTLDSADYLVLLDETTIPDDQEQVEDRIHRASRMHNVTIYYLRTKGTIDEEIAYVAAARADVQQWLLDGSRGVESAKEMFYNKPQGE